MSLSPSRLKTGSPAGRTAARTRRFFVPSMPAQAGMEPRHSAPPGGRRAAPWGQS